MVFGIAEAVAGNPGTIDKIAGAVAGESRTTTELAGMVALGRTGISSITRCMTKIPAASIHLFVTKNIQTEEYYKSEYDTSKAGKHSSKTKLRYYCPACGHRHYEFSAFR